MKNHHVRVHRSEENLERKDQLAWKLAEVAVDDVEVLHGDTAISPRGLDTYGSRSLVVGGEALVRAVDKVIEANPDIAAKIRDGKVQAAGALIGQVMKEMRGQADAGRVRELVLEKLT